ncbi:MAG: hypothetical protein JJ855_18390 [Rhodospirillales bacterium]|nr:hypothetical protein [Rhodospirillales bacterium]
MNERDLLAQAEKKINHLNRCARAYSLAYQQLKTEHDKQQIETRALENRVAELEALLSASDDNVTRAVAALQSLRGRMEDFRSRSATVVDAVQRSVSTSDLMNNVENLVRAVDVDQEVEVIEAHEQALASLARFRK